MTRISFLNTYSSDAESHTLTHEFLWYFHYKHLQQSEKLALKHHRSLKTSRAIYFYKHMRKPSFFFFLFQAWKKSIMFENLFSVSLILVFKKKPSRLLGFNMGSGYLRGSVALMKIACVWRLFCSLVSLKCSTRRTEVPVVFYTTCSPTTPNLVQLTLVCSKRLLF